MESLGQGGPNKTICRMIGPEIKKFFFQGPFFSIVPTYLPNVRLCV